MAVKNRYILTLACVVFMAFSLVPTQAQHYIGVRGGYGSGSGRFNPTEDQGALWGLYNGGISWKFYTDEKFVGGVEVDILYMQQGFKTFKTERGQTADEPAKRIGYSQRKYNTIMVPIFWQPHIYMFQQKLRIFLNAGITFSYNLNATYEERETLDSEVVSGKYELRTARDNRFMYGLCAGGGISWAFNRFEIFSEIRYYIGYGDVQKNKTKYPPNEPYNRTPLDAMQVSAGVYYRLGKGGIRSRLSGRALYRLQEKEWEKRQQELKLIEDRETVGQEGIEPASDGMTEPVEIIENGLEIETENIIPINEPDTANGKALDPITNTGQPDHKQEAQTNEGEDVPDINNLSE